MAEAFWRVGPGFAPERTGRVLLALGAVVDRTIDICGYRGAVTARPVLTKDAGVVGSIGRHGAVRSRAWIWDFSSTHSTRAFPGVKAHDVADLVDELRVRELRRTHPGLRPALPIP